MWVEPDAVTPRSEGTCLRKTGFLLWRLIRLGRTKTPMISAPSRDARRSTEALVMRSVGVS